MTEFKLVGTLILVLLLQLCLLPFRAVAFVFQFIESFCRIIKDTINNLIKSIMSELKQ